MPSFAAGYNGVDRGRYLIRRRTVNHESRFRQDGPKLPVDPTLNEDLVTQAKSVTGNLSGVVESLLGEYVGRERPRCGCLKTFGTQIWVNPCDARGRRCGRVRYNLNHERHCR
jgi:hypothetical protein